MTDCKGCRFWAFDPMVAMDDLEEAAPFGKCRRYAPRAGALDINTDETLYAEWAETMYSDWCGDWKARAMPEDAG